MARAVRFLKYGGPEVLETVQMDVPVAGDGEIVVEVRAAGVNPVDSKILAGARNPAPITSPRGLGSDAAGVVVQVGAGVSGFEVGDEVVGHGLSGAFASVVVGASRLFTQKPASVSFDEGAAIGIPVATAYQLLKSLGVKSGETVLIHAGSGGVGQAAIQFAKLWGATVVATASPANHDRLRELGAIPVAYGDGLLERVRSAAPQGVDAVLDAAGTREAIDVSLALVDDRSRIGEIVVAGWAAEYGVTVFSGGLPGSVGPAEIAWREESIGVVLDLLQQGKFDLEIAERYPLDRVADAMRHSASGHVRGKIVLLP
jgi:NADPH2:quinone reductase